MTKISTVNHTDPNYWDLCLEKTGELCDYCCLTDFEWCARDISICDPITDRDIKLIWHMFCIIGGIALGFPIVGYILKVLLIKRCCRNYFRSSDGVSCFECFCRFMLFTFCCRRFSEEYEQADPDDETGTTRGCFKKGKEKRAYPDIVESYADRDEAEDE